MDTDLGTLAAADHLGAVENSIATDGSGVVVVLVTTLPLCVAAADNAARRNRRS